MAEIPFVPLDRSNGNCLNGSKFKGGAVIGAVLVPEDPPIVDARSDSRSLLPIADLLGVMRRLTLLSCKSLPGSAGAE